MLKCYLSKIDLKDKRVRCIGVAVFFLLMAVGIRVCRQDYSDPQAFFDKYFMEDWFNPRYGKAWQKAMHIKEVEIKNLRLDAVDGMSAVCAEVRLIPEPGVVYIDTSFDPWNIKTTESWDNSLSGSRLDSDCYLRANVKIKRFKMDNGVFAPTEPVRDRDGIGYAVHGFCFLNHLQVYKKEDSVVMAKMLESLVEKIEEGANSNDRSVAELLLKNQTWTGYAYGNQFRFINDDALKTRLYNALEKVFVLSEWDKRERRDADSAKRVLCLAKTSVSTYEGLKSDLAALERMGQEGFALFQAIEKTNKSRKGDGEPAIWPTKHGKIKRSTKHGEVKQPKTGGIVQPSRLLRTRNVLDIKKSWETPYQTSKEYFSEILDMGNHQRQNWNPYINAEPGIVFDGSLVRWNVLVDDDDLMDTYRDEVPALISANLDCWKLFSALKDRERSIDKIIPINMCTKIGNSGIVIVYRSGRVKCLPENKVTLRNIYGDGIGKSWIGWVGKYYLTPKGYSQFQR